MCRSMRWTLALLVVASLMLATACRTIRDSGGGDRALGDEPPIRVKNGSLDLEIIGNGHKWKNRGSYYEFTGGRRQFDYYVVDVRPRDSRLCSGPTRAKGGTLTLTFRDDSAAIKTVTVTLTVVNNKTKVTWQPASYVPTTVQGDKILRFGVQGQGYIGQLVIDQTTCDFTDAAALEDALVNDFKP